MTDLSVLRPAAPYLGLELAEAAEPGRECAQRRKDIAVPGQRVILLPRPASGQPVLLGSEARQLHLGVLRF
jgi:hypothetical protein